MDSFEDRVSRIKEEQYQRNIRGLAGFEPYQQMINEREKEQQKLINQRGNKMPENKVKIQFIELPMSHFQNKIDKIKNSGINLGLETGYLTELNTDYVSPDFTLTETEQEVEQKQLIEKRGNKMNDNKTKLEELAEIFKTAFEQIKENEIDMVIQYNGKPKTYENYEVYDIRVDNETQAERVLKLSDKMSKLLPFTKSIKSEMLNQAVHNDDSENCLPILSCVLSKQVGQLNDKVLHGNKEDMIHEITQASAVLFSMYLKLVEEEN